MYFYKFDTIVSYEVILYLSSFKFDYFYLFIFNFYNFIIVGVFSNEKFPQFLSTLELFIFNWLFVIG